jgi:hypothetical protein
MRLKIASALLIVGCIATGLGLSSFKDGGAKGCHVYGKIKFVDYGEDYKIKWVTYGEDLKIKYVTYGEDKEGLWKTVDYGEKYKIKIVDYGEDFKVKEVDYGEGCN